MTNEVYYICFRCGSIKDDKEWFAWRENEQRLREYRIHKTGMSPKAWQRCSDGDKVLQEWIPQRCLQHGENVPSLRLSNLRARDAQNWCQKRPAREAGTKETITLVVRRTLDSPGTGCGLHLAHLGRVTGSAPSPPTTLYQHLTDVRRPSRH